MKLAERYFTDDGKIIIQQTHDPNPTLNTVAAMRSAGIEGFGHNKLAARIPGWLIEQWLIEAGVSYQDEAAKREIIKKKILSGDIQKLRLWEGTY